MKLISNKIFFILLLADTSRVEARCSDQLNVVARSHYHPSHSHRHHQTIYKRRHHITHNRSRANSSRSNSYQRHHQHQLKHQVSPHITRVARKRSHKQLQHRPVSYSVALISVKSIAFVCHIRSPFAIHARPVSVA